MSNLTYYSQVENDFNTPVSLKRSLSDPEIYFPSAVRHSLIVAVNGILPHDRQNGAASARSLNGDKICNGGAGSTETTTLLKSSTHSKSDRYLQPRPPQDGADGSLQIDINVIQPTPNISPSQSLRSFSVEDRDALSSTGRETFAGIPFLIVPPSPVRNRRVSFSDHSQSSEDAVSLGVPGHPNISISVVHDEEPAGGGAVAAQRRSRCVRQASLQVTDTC